MTKRLDDALYAATAEFSKLLDLKEQEGQVKIDQAKLKVREMLRATRHMLESQSETALALLSSEQQKTQKELESQYLMLQERIKGPEMDALADEVISKLLEVKS